MISLVRWVIRLAAMMVTVVFFIRFVQSFQQNAPQKHLPESRASSPFALRLNTGTITCRGQDLGAEALIQIPDLISLGRGADNDVVLHDPFASSHHAWVLYQHGSLWIKDLGAKNPTSVNGKKLLGTREIRPGDEIIIGNTIFVVVSR